jgi:NADPH:quinone reductase-like Zn-dependent oxidoreductase
VRSGWLRRTGRGAGLGGVGAAGRPRHGRAATFTQSYCTALFALRNRAHLHDGEVVLVLGGGGVGLATIDVAMALGGIAIGAASTPAKRAAATAAGARAVIDTTSEVVKDRSRALAAELTHDSRPTGT